MTPLQLRDEPTLVSLFARRVDQGGERPALHVKRGGRFRPVSWNRLARDVCATAVGLVGLGVQPGDRIVQVAENRYEWIVCDLAIQMAQAVHVPVHATLTGQQIAYQIRDCGARVVFLSGPEQVDKLAGCCGRLTSVSRYISFDRCSRAIGGHEVEHLGDWLAGVSDPLAGRIKQRAVEAVTPDWLATILYTSGTTGEPKGVMLSHRNLTSNTLATLEAFEQRPDDVRLSFLPFSHIFARTCDIYTWIAAGSQLALAESRETVLDDCAEVKPTLLNGVPYFFDKVRRQLAEQGRAEEPGSLRELLGGRIRLCCCGGAALPEHVFQFYANQGVPILQGYGLTETSPVISTSTQRHNKCGRVGRPIPGVEVKIAADGEILTRGPHVMLGYYNDQAATDEVMRDGWFHTGDLGQLDDEGFLKITGRKKEIIVTSGGKNVAPVLLEALLTEDPLILQATVVGDGRNYLSALIVPDWDRLRAEMTARGVHLPGKRAAPDHPEVVQLYQRRIQERLSSVSYYEQVRKFTLLERSFTVERGELTPKLSLRRKVIEANFAEQIEAMYRKGAARQPGVATGPARGGG